MRKSRGSSPGQRIPPLNIKNEAVSTASIGTSPRRRSHKSGSSLLPHRTLSITASRAGSLPPVTLPDPRPRPPDPIPVGGSGCRSCWAGSSAVRQAAQTGSRGVGSSHIPTTRQALLSRARTIAWRRLDGSCGDICCPGVVREWRRGDCGCKHTRAWT